LRFAARLDDVAIGIFLDELDGGIEGIEFLIRNNGDAGLLQLFLAEGAIVFEIIGVRRAAMTGCRRRRRVCALVPLAEGVIKNDNVGPVGVLFPVLGFGDEAIGDVAFFFRFTVVAKLRGLLCLTCQAISPIKPESEAKRNFRLSMRRAFRPSAKGMEAL